jgi:hypothetical protein
MGIPWDTLLRSMRHYFRLQVLGVLAPGVLTLLEVAYWALPARARGSPLSAVTYLSQRSMHLGTATQVIIALIFLFSAYIIGFILRQAVWSGVGRLAKEPLWSEIEGELCRNYSAEAISSVIALHPAINRPQGISATGIRRYAKVWLQQTRPPLALDYIEGEINVVFANVVPFTVAPFIIVSWIAHRPAEFWPVAAASSLIMAWLLITYGRRLRDSTEPYETIFSFLMAHWIADTALARAEAGSPVPDAPDLASADAAAAVPVAAAVPAPGASPE